MDSYDEVDGENKRKKPERINAVANSLGDDAESNDQFNLCLLMIRATFR